MRNAGILCHISSLPSPHGIGTYGKEAYEFVDFLERTKQTYWQILPLGPTSYGDSPYQTFSAFANNPYFIDLDILVEKKLLLKSEIEPIESELCKVDYAQLYQKRYISLKKAFERFDLNDKGFIEFCDKESFWLENYATFMAIKASYNNQSLLYWDEEVRTKVPHVMRKIKQDLIHDIRFHKFLQYESNRQWHELKSYANQKGIQIIGDMPIYVSYDSSDVWSNPSMFQLDEHLIPIRVAGVPPDNYAIDGQLWGNPLYHWEHMKAQNYKWWIQRVKAAMQMFDAIRIDHFIGFVNYYSIPYGDENARRGEWIKGPGIDIFETIKEELGDLNIIAEDLGEVTPEVRKVLKETGYPGMKLLQFGFDASGKSDYLPHHYDRNTIAYTGTHDNMTSKTWFESLNEAEQKFFLKYTNCCASQSRVQCLIKETLKSPSKTAIIPIQDYLELGREARMNVPSTLGGNWQWRLEPLQLTKQLETKILNYTHLFDREKK